MSVRSSQGYPLLIAPVKMWGHAYVLCLPRWARESLGVTVGSLMAMRIHAPYATLRRFETPSVPVPADFEADRLPPGSAAELQAWDSVTLPPVKVR